MPNLPLYACRQCGATTYRPVIQRDATGALRPTEMYRCSGCSVVFTDPKAWRDGGGDGPPPRPPAPPARPVQGFDPMGPQLAPRPPDLTRYGS